MSLVHGSPRMTTDIDLTAGFQPQAGIDAVILDKLDSVLPGTVAKLGYVGARAVVHRVEVWPKKFADNIEEASWPALKAFIRYYSGSGRRRYEDRFKIDISFNEPAVRHVEILDIGGDGRLPAYAPAEVVAEKLRAILQQPVRDRIRHQDVFDIEFLLREYEFDAAQKASILEALIEKCQSRGIDPGIDSFEDAEIRERAGRAWPLIKLETGGDLPEFGHCYETVRQFYRQLPWTNA